MADRVQVLVSGRVQGVGYRYFVEHVARQLDLRGHVRNRADGSVEAVAEGSREDLDQFVDQLRRGPHASEVTDLTAAWSMASGEFADFSVVA
ncbi:MAG: acylphosphatase [Capsulimonadaceae bacterium]